MIDPCSCCGRPWAACYPDSSPRRDLRAFVCDQCQRHQTGPDMQKNREHVQFWQKFTAGQERVHTAEVSRLEGRIADLEKAVREGAGVTEIAEAREKAWQAYRSRDNAYQALCEIRLLHRDVGSGKCRCGKRFDHCEVAQIVDRYPALAKWEKVQVERYRNGEDHALPEHHPARLDPHWRQD